MSLLLLLRPKASEETTPQITTIGGSFAKIKDWSRKKRKAKPTPVVEEVIEKAQELSKKVEEYTEAARIPEPDFAALYRIQLAIRSIEERLQEIVRNQEAQRISEMRRVAAMIAEMMEQQRLLQEDNELKEVAVALFHLIDD